MGEKVLEVIKKIRIVMIMLLPNTISLPFTEIFFLKIKNFIQGKGFLFPIVGIILIQLFFRKFLVLDNSYINLSYTFLETVENYFNIEKYIDTKNLLNIYLGLVTLLFSIYLYCMGIGNSFKKSVLIYLIGGGDILYLLTSILLLFLFNIDFLVILVFILLAFFKLYKVIKLIFETINEKEFQENFPSIIEKIKDSNESNSLYNLYYEIRKFLYSSFTNKDSLSFKEGLNYYSKVLTHNNLKNSKKHIIEIDEREKNNAIENLYDFFKQVLDKPDQKLYKELCLFTDELKSFYMNNDLIKAQLYYNLIDIQYKYLEKTKEEGQEMSDLIDFNFLSDYIHMHFENEEQQIIIYKSILSLFNTTIKKNDFKTFEKIKPILQDEFSHQKNIIQNYAIIIVNALLSDDKYKKWRIKLNKNYTLEDTKQLEEIFKRNYELDYKFKANDFTNTPPDINGISTGTSLRTRYVIIELLNEIFEECSDKFVLENYPILENRAFYLNLENIKLRLDKLKNEINLKKAEKISKNILKESDIEKFYNSVVDHEAGCMKFILDCLCENGEKRITKTQSEEIWEVNKWGVEVVHKNDIVLHRALPFQYVYPSVEFFLVKALKRNVTKEIKLSQIDNTKQWCLIIDRHNCNDFINNDIKKMTNIKIHHLVYQNELEFPFVIEAKSIDQIIDYLPKNYNRKGPFFVEVDPLNKYEECPKELLDLINVDDIVNKKLIAKGYSLLKVYRNMEITFKENVEIYNVIK